MGGDGRLKLHIRPRLIKEYWENMAVVRLNNSRCSEVKCLDEWAHFQFFFILCEMEKWIVDFLSHPQLLQ